MEAITGGTLTDYLFIIILVLIEAGILLGASALICKYTKIKANSQTRLYSVFCIANAVLLALVGLYIAVCMIFPLNDDLAFLGVFAFFYVVPSLVIMQIIGLVSIIVKKNSDKKIDRLLSKAEDEIENAIKNSDKINKDKT